MIFLLKPVRVFSFLAEDPILFQKLMISYIKLPIFNSLLGLSVHEVSCLVMMFLSYRLFSNRLIIAVGRDLFWNLKAMRRLSFSNMFSAFVILLFSKRLAVWELYLAEKQILKAFFCRVLSIFSYFFVILDIQIREQ